MDANKAKSIFKVTNMLHEQVDDVYESLMDGTVQEATKSLDILMTSVKEVKNNISNKDEI